MKRIALHLKRGRDAVRLRQVDAVIVGADRVAANGDVANKIGTYALAVLALHHNVSFMVAAPTSTIDLATPDGAAISIEERPAEEVTMIRGVRIAPVGTVARNLAFDITPAWLVTAIVTERGVARSPFPESLPRLVNQPVDTPLADRPVIPTS